MLLNIYDLVFTTKLRSIETFKITFKNLIMRTVSSDINNKEPDSRLAT